MAIKFRRGTAAKAAASEEVLEAGQPFLETTNHNLYVGDGTTKIKNLRKGLVTGEFDTIGDQYPKKISITGDMNTRVTITGLNPSGEAAGDGEAIIDSNGVTPRGSTRQSTWPLNSDLKDSSESGSGWYNTLAVQGYVDQKSPSHQDIFASSWSIGSIEDFSNPVVFIGSIYAIDTSKIKVGDTITVSGANLTGFDVRQDVSNGTMIFLTVVYIQDSYINCTGYLQGYGPVTATLSRSSNVTSITVTLSGSIGVGIMLSSVYASIVDADTSSTGQYDIYLEMLVNSSETGLYQKIRAAGASGSMSPLASYIHQNALDTKAAVVLNPHSYYKLATASALYDQRAEKQITLWKGDPNGSSFILRTASPDTYISPHEATAVNYLDLWTTPEISPNPGK